MTLLLSHPTLAAPAAPSPCDVCGHTSPAFQWSLRFDGYPGAFDLWRCRSCGLVWNWPQLPPRAIEDQYDATYYVFAFPPARRWSRTTQLYMNHLYPLERTRGARRLLEIGCAGGELLALARARGWDVEGIEISAGAAEAARCEYGLSVHTGTLEENSGGIGQFDVLIATDVIEHVTSPRRFALAARRVLRPGGIAVIETPNWGSLWRQLSGPGWLGLNRFHLHLFDGRSLRMLMQSCGFTNCRLGTTTNFTYSHWGDRPELTRWVHHLPASLHWRVIWWLNHLTLRSAATELKNDPVASLDEAVRRVEKAAACPDLWHPSRRLTGDNLVVRAEMGPQPVIQCATDSSNRKGSSKF